MNLGLEDRVAWVLGASSGLGLACARSLSSEGARVAMSARTTGPLEEAAAALGESAGDARAFPLDVTDAAAIAATAGRIAHEMGPVRILVANAAGPPPGPFEAHDDPVLMSAFELTIASAWRLTKAVLPQMREAGGGCLIYITSWSTKELIPGLLLSNMLRPAVVGMMKTLSKELGPDGIRALCVAPGRMDTPRLQELDELNAAASGRPVETVREASQATIPAGRYGRPEEFGDAVAFLASDRAAYISGITVAVDGGMLNGLLS